MDFWSAFNTTMDTVLMPFFRYFDTPIVGYYFGVFVLCVICVILGDLTFNIVVRADRRKIRETTDETIKYNNLSIEALQSGEGESYHACNKLANEAFGRMFFLQLALSTAALWPLPFSMSWLQYRFFGVEFPLPFIPLTFNYAGVFIPMYILCRVLYGQFRHKLPFFRGAKKIFAGMQEESERMKSWRELMPAPAKKKAAEASA